MIFGIVLLFVIWITWMLLVKGYLWKSILLIAGWFGLRLLLPAYLPWTGATTLIFSHPVTIAACIASVVCFLALLTTKDD